MRSFNIFGICACILVASTMAADANINNDNCNMMAYIRCASLVGQMESFDTLTNNRTCQVLAEAKTCLSDLLRQCQYDCTKEKMDPTFEDGQGCMLHSKTYEMPLIDNDGDYAHPCRMTKYMEGCLDYSCPNGRHYLANKKTLVPNLDEAQFSGREIESLKEMSECTNRRIVKYTRPYDDYYLKFLTRDLCIKIRLSFHYLVDAFSMSETSGQCSGSDVQGMVVNIAASGVKHYVDYCDSLPSGAEVFPANSLSTSLLTAGAVVISLYIIMSSH